VRGELVLKTHLVAHTSEIPLARVSAHVRTKKRGKNLFAYFVVTPAVLFFMIFFYYPFFVNMYYMFTDYNYIAEIHFVGFSNILHFFHDPNIGISFSNTFLITLIGVPVALVLALLVAIAVFYMTLGKSLIRSAIFSTTLVSTIVAAIIFKLWFGQELGFIDNILASLHVARIPWLTQPSWALIGIVLVSVWGSLGYNMVIYLAGLSNVNRELVEAARIDGANALQRFLSIIIPQLRPTIIFLAITLVINSLKTYVQVAILTNGAPYGSTRTVLLYMFQEGFDLQHVGYAAVIAFALFLCTLIVTLIQLRVTRISAD